jgi:hypothetical protein
MNLNSTSVMRLVLIGRVSAAWLLTEESLGR